jgi:hypothetical protein
MREETANRILYLRWPITCPVERMIGWMMIFAFLAVPGVIVTFAVDPATASISLKLASILFGTLFFLCALPRVVRGRA